MQVQISEGRIEVCDTSDFDAEKTLECGQVFRFKKRASSDYDLFASGKRCRIFTTDAKTVIETPDTEFFYRYFDLDTDYGKIYNALSKFPELELPLAYSRGIRILRQDTFETIISFIISANNNILRIQGIIERLCDSFGERKDGYNAFITKERLAALTRGELDCIKAGFRADYIYKNAKLLLNDEFYEGLNCASEAEAEQMLLNLSGVGPKVASCVLLFGLYKTRSYPVDTWIFKANGTKELDTPEKVRAYYLERYGELAGFAQQYIFYHKRSGN